LRSYALRSGSAVYLDSSAIVKLAVVEAESDALRRYLAPFSLQFTSIIARVEVVRAVRGAEPSSVPLARAILDSMESLELTDAVVNMAAQLEPPLLRSLDAVHLASALLLQPRLDTLVTYDRRMLAVAQMAGLRTAAPT
jgi:uncharacterized protein